MFDQWLSKLGERLPNGTEWLATVSLATFLLVGPETILFRVPTFVALLAVLTFPRLSSSESLWLALAGVYAFDLGVNWQNLNTFMYLIWYWTLIMAFAGLHATGAVSSLVTPARLLLGVHFFLAAVSKLIAPDFVSGNTLAFLLLHEPRFFPITMLTTEIDLDTLNHNRQFLNSLIEYPTVGEVLIVNPGVQFVASALTYHTLVVEVALGIMFIAGFKYRDYLLMYFVLSTQMVMTVVGFAALHCLLGYAQAANPRLRALYMVSFLLSVVAVLLIPLRDWLLRL